MKEMIGYSKTTQKPKSTPPDLSDLFQMIIGSFKTYLCSKDLDHPITLILENSFVPLLKEELSSCCLGAVDLLKQTNMAVSDDLGGFLHDQELGIMIRSDQT